MNNNDTDIYIKLRELTESLLANAGLQKLLEIIERMLDRPAIITDMSFRVITESPAAVNVSEYHYFYQDILFLDERSIELIRTHYLYKKMREREFSSTIIPHPSLKSFLAASIKASSADILILTVFQDTAPFSPDDLELIKRICQILSLEFQKENSFNRYRLSIPNHIISSLLNGKVIPRDEILYKLSYIDWVSARELYIMIIADTDGYDLGSRISSIVNSLKLFIPTEHCLVYESNIVVFLTPVIYQSLYVDKQVQFSEFLEYNHLSCVTSLGFTDVTNSRYYYLMAKNALATALKHEIRLGLFQDMAYPIIADSLERHYHITDFCHPAILQLLKYDYENHTDYFPTLDVYLQYKNEPDAAAGKLYIHRSTLFYRIKKIKELIGISLEKADEISSVYFTLQMINMRGKAEFLTDVLNRDISIYADSRKRTKRTDYHDRISFVNDRFFFKLLEDMDSIPQILEISDNTIVTPHIDGSTLYDLLWAYEDGKLLPDKLIDVFLELLNQLKLIQQRVSAQLKSYICFNFDFLSCIKLTERNQLVITSFESIVYAEEPDIYAMVIALICHYTFGDNRRKPWLVSTLTSQYSQILEIPESDFKKAVNRRLSYMKKRVTIQKKTAKATAVILAGGKSARMNNLPKHSFRIGNFTFLEHIIHTLRGFDDLQVSINENIDGYTVVNDIYIGIGPIGGIYSALKQTKKPYIFVVACDIPNISQDFIDYLFLNLSDKDSCLVPVADSQIQPLCAIYRKDMLPVMEAQIKADNFKLKALLESGKTHYLEVPSKFKKDLQDINTFELYEKQLDEVHKRENLSPLTFEDITIKVR